MSSPSLLLIVTLLCTFLSLGYGGRRQQVATVLEDEVFGEDGGVTMEENPLTDDPIAFGIDEADSSTGSNEEGANVLPEPNLEEEDNENEDQNGAGSDSTGAEPQKVDSNESEDDGDNSDIDKALGSEEEDEDEDVANGYEEDGVALRRKKRQTQREWTLSKPNHPLHVSLVMLDMPHHRSRRTSYNITSNTWPHRIPYSYDHFDEGLKHQLEEVLKFLEDHVCVKFFNEIGFDPKNPNWFKEHGYSTNAYIRFRSRSTCAAVYGRGKKDKGGRSVSPCTQWVSMMHEVIHSLGGIHSQNYPLRESYITVHEGNIQDGYKGNFKKYEPDSKEVEFEDFDPTSLLMYSRGFFSKTGQFTFDYVRPEMANLYGPATYRNIVLELNKNYQCIETFCQDMDKDCGTGYMGFVKQKCACVCPIGFDPDTKCKSLINSADTSIQWPDTGFSLYKADDCPAGTETGRIPLHVAKHRMNLKKLKNNGSTIYIDTCTKTSGSSDYESWPIGSYCIGKAKDVPCSAPFEEGEVTVKTKSQSTLTGSVGDVSVNGKKVTMRYCCRTEGNTAIPMKMPTDKPFRLMRNDISCQEVDGMWTLPGYIITKGKASKRGAAPKVRISRVGMFQTSCYYQPPTYGCSQEVLLDSSTPTATVSAPTVTGPKSKKIIFRESNRRCFYYFQAPEGSRLRLTFKKLKLHPSDRVLVKRFNLLENPYAIDLTRPPYQMITERNQLQIEYWSYYESKSQYSGADIQVDLLPPENMCYDADLKGADYAGNKAVSETYEGCLPWSQATACPDFPWEGTNGLQLLNSGNACRNLDKPRMLQPWCYTYASGTTCQRRYCDVCNEAETVDNVANCKTYIDADPNFCTAALGRFGCFKSCGMDTSPYKKADVKCSKPVLPSEITAQGGLQESYDVGAKVALSCGEIECTTQGWTPFDDSCTAQCVDASQLCENAITKFPEFCTNEKSKDAAEKYCKKSCGKCDAASCSVSTGDSYSTEAGSANSVSTGQNVEFACKDGLSHVSGDLRRACSVSGALLGKEPVCQAAPVNINIDQIFVKTRTISRSTVYLMLGDGLEVPFDGKITRWYYYCNNDLTVTLLVYRKGENAKEFNLVGYNKAKCVPGWPWSYDVPGGDQIAVEKGDFLGVYDNKYSIVIQPCGSAEVKLAPAVMVKVRNEGALLKKKVMEFSKSTCAYLGIGARVTPN